MSYRRTIYSPEEVDEQAYFQHQLALAGHSDVRELARLTRMRDVNFTTSFMRYSQPRIGMYQEHPVYGEDCTVPVITQPSTFEPDNGLQHQVYRNYAYAAPEIAATSQIYPSATDAYAIQNELPHMVASHPGVAIGSGGENPARLNDLSIISRRSDLQWITTTSHDVRTQSPHNTSSPRPQMPPLYPSQSTPPNITLNPSGMMDDGQASMANVGHHQFNQVGYSGASRTGHSSSSRSKKSTNPTKPKGTPGRKRKFQDYELTPEEAVKRRVRRERNKVAAAKCRNRRRELTDRLQGETDHLEDHQSQLQQEIYSLEQEKEHLEFILAAHSPNCNKAMLRGAEPVPLVTGDERSQCESGIADVSFVSTHPVVDDMMSVAPSDPQFFYVQQGHPATAMSAAAPQNVPQKLDAKLESPIKLEGSEEPKDLGVSSNNLPTDLSSRSNPQQSSPTILLSLPTMGLNSTLSEDSLDTPVCTLATPSYSSSGIFTFPTTPTVCNTTTEVSDSSVGSLSFSSRSNFSFSSPSTTFATPALYRPTATSSQPCSLAHRRRSSSDSHTSPDSVNLLAL